MERTGEPRSLTWQTAAWGAAAYLALLSGAVSAEQPLGRLFFTPEQRATLESLRLAPATATQATPTDRVSVDGIVQRSGGPATVWINGVPQTMPQRALVPSRKGGAPAVDVAVPARDERVRLRVGESVIIAPSAEESEAAAPAPPAARQPPGAP